MNVIATYRSRDDLGNRRFPTGVSRWTAPETGAFQWEFAMSTVLIIVLLILLLGGGGYYGHRSYGTAGLGGVLGLVLVIVLILWLLGALGGARVA